MERQNFIETLQLHAQASTRTQLTVGIVEAARSVEKKYKILSGAARRKAASVFATVIFEQFLSKTQKKTARSQTVDPKIVPVQNEDDEFEQFWKECEKLPQEHGNSFQATRSTAWNIFAHFRQCMKPGAMVDRTFKFLESITTRERSRQDNMINAADEGRFEAYIDYRLTWMIPPAFGNASCLPMIMSI